MRKAGGILFKLGMAALCMARNRHQTACPHHCCRLVAEHGGGPSCTLTHHGLNGCFCLCACPLGRRPVALWTRLLTTVPVAPPRCGGSARRGPTTPPSLPAHARVWKGRPTTALSSVPTPLEEPAHGVMTCRGRARVRGEVSPFPRAFASGQKRSERSDSCVRTEKEEENVQV